MIFAKRIFSHLLVVLFILAASVSLQSADLRTRARQATDEFKDVSLVCKVLYANMSELKKISKDFDKSYEFKKTTIKSKSPDKMKMEGKLGIVRVKMLINGDTKGFHFPIRGWVKENIKGEPHKRQTEFDIGIFTDSLWSDYNVREVKVETNSDKAYRITFCRRNSPDKKMVCWVDYDCLKLLKLENYESDGSLIVRYLYTDHKQINGIWIPTRIEVYNGQGRHAGTSAYESIKINCGIPDSEFKF